MAVENLSKQKKLIPKSRGIRKSKHAFKDAIELKVKSETATNQFDVIIQKLTNLSSTEYCNEQVENCISFVIGAIEFLYYIPIGDQIDVEARK